VKLVLLLSSAFYKVWAVIIATFKREEGRKRGNITTPARTRSKSSILIPACLACLEIFRNKKTISKEVKVVLYFLI